MTRALCAGVLLMSAVVSGQTPAAPTIVESSLESRFQLDLRVPDAVLAKMLPTGFAPNIAAQGAAKDCNLRVIFIERLSVNGPDGKPIGSGSNRIAYLVAPVKDPAGANAQMVIGGLTEDAADAPGPFGNYLRATTHTMKRMVSSGTGPIAESQDWVFEAASGEHLEMHITFERGAANRSNPSETRFYSAKDPAIVQTSRQEQVLDILRNTTTNPVDRVKAFAFKGAGGSYAALFDGTEKLLSWDNILWMNRSIIVK